MSAIYDRLAQQKTALQAVPTYGVSVSLDQPMAGDDPAEGIYLDPAIGMSTDSGRTLITAAWVCVVIGTPDSLLSRALNAQDAMMEALQPPACVLNSIARAPLADRTAAAQVMSVAVATQFTITEN